LLRSSPHEARLSARWVSALALVLTAELTSAACVSAQAAAPFPVVEIQQPRRQSHFFAYLVIGSGAALVGGSFVLSQEADDAYAAYLRETDPAQIEHFYDRAVTFDKLASASLATGEILFVTGIYLRFIKQPRDSRLGLVVGPGRCGLSLRY
jgi:hypothetical protein